MRGNQTTKRIDHGVSRERMCKNEGDNKRSHVSPTLCVTQHVSSRIK